MVPQPVGRRRHWIVSPIYAYCCMHDGQSLAQGGSPTAQKAMFHRIGNIASRGVSVLIGATRAEVRLQTEACGLWRNPPAAWRAVARTHLPSWAIFQGTPQPGGRLRPTPPGRRRDRKAQSARRGGCRLRLYVRHWARMRFSVRSNAQNAPLREATPRLPR